MWLEKLRELKKAKGLSSRQIAEMTDVPERTIKRVFTGETENPYMDTIRRIAKVLDVSLDELFTEGGAVVGRESMSVLQEKYDKLCEEMTALRTEHAIAQDKNTFLENENEQLKAKLAQCEKMLLLHESYIKYLSDHPDTASNSQGRGHRSSRIGYINNKRGK